MFERLKGGEEYECLIECGGVCRTISHTCSRPSSPSNTIFCTFAVFCFVLRIGLLWPCKFIFIVSELVFAEVPRLNPFVEHDVEFFICAVFGLRQSEVRPYIS